MAHPYRPQIVHDRRLLTLDQLVIELYEIILEILARLSIITTTTLQEPTIRMNPEMSNVLPPLPDLLASVAAISNNSNIQPSSNNESNNTQSRTSGRSSQQPFRRCRCRRHGSSARHRSSSNNQQQQQQRRLEADLCMICPDFQAPFQEREETEAADKKETGMLSVLLPRSLTRNPVITAVIFLIGWGVISRLR